MSAADRDDMLTLNRPNHSMSESWDVGSHSAGISGSSCQKELNGAFALYSER